MDGAESSLVPGYRLDRYELLCPIATGGMASVWLARLRGKRGFEKLFAVKTIKTELISDPHFQEMFLDEARIASRIIHPNVAQILELGEQDDILYLVMEFVDGDSLAKIHRYAMKCGSPLPPGVSLRIIADACSGLHAAHQLKDGGELLGVVHRDVSPQNILLSSEGTAKVIDFGLVKAKNRSAGETKSGVVKGKIRYMAPEQVGGKAIDHRADVWALGMCLYELITGHVPYHDDDELEVVKRLMSDSPLPAMDIALPPEIEKVISRAIVADPAGRFESCAAMRRAIEQAIHQLELPAENEEVAAFVRDTLPELGTKRTKTIAKAVAAAESRVTHTDSLEGLGPGDMAFAKTEVSAREHETPLPLTRKREESSSYGAARTTSATRLMDDLGERKRRTSVGLWVAAIVVAGVAAFLLWPRREPVDATSTPTAASAAPSASALASASASAEPPPPIESAAPSASNDLELESEPKASPSLLPLPHPGLPLATAAPPVLRDAAAPASTGLSPGAASAAAFMLTPKSPPTSSASPAPSQEAPKQE